MISAITGVSCFNYKNVEGKGNAKKPCILNNAALHRISKPQHNSDIICFTSSIGKLQNTLPKKYDLKGKTILITGGTGTLGNSIIKTLLSDYSPKKIIVFSRDEMKQHSMKLANKEPKISYIIGDVRDEKVLKKAFKEVDVVIHTAAMKHISICEENPEEAIKTNIDGSKNIINAALNSDVQRVLFISTDKAALPTSLYGATKFVAEKLFIDANTHADGAPKFSCIRLGNIAGSRGSIIPIFKEQGKLGTIKITDKDMTRFFMTPKEASKLALSSIEIMNGEEIFIPKAKNIKITDLAKEIAPNAKIEYIGASTGEKLSESFITNSEQKYSLDLNDRFLILPKREFENRNKHWKNASQLPNDFDYSSANEKYKMTKSELNQLINNA